MRLLLVLDQLASGGTEWQLVYTLPKMRPRVEAITLAVLFPPPEGGSSGPLAKVLEENDVEVRHLRLSRRWDLPRNTRALHRVIRAVRPDVIHARHYFSGLLTASTKAMAPKPRRVVSFHNLAYEFETSWKGQVRKAIDRVASFAAIDAFAAVSTKTKQSYERHLGVGPIVVVPNSVPAERIRAMEPEPGLLERYGLDPSEPFVLVPARQVAVKGHRHFVEALARFERAPKTLFAGRGPETENTRRAIAKHGLEDRIVLAGEDLPHDDVLRLMRAAIVVVLPSTHEGFPNAAAEAMAAGTAFLGTEVGGMLDLVEDGTSGLLVPSRDPAALHAALSRLLEDDALRARLAAAGQARVLAEFGVDGVVERWLSFYRSA